MIAVPVDAMTLDPGYQPPAIMREVGSAPAFAPADIEPPQKRGPFFRTAKPSADRDEAAHGLSTSVTYSLIHFVDPESDLVSELERKARDTRDIRQAYKARVEALRTDAALDGFAISEASERDFWAFIRSGPFIRKGGLVAMDNGNLRAIWKAEDDSHVGLQFLGNRTVQYVIFKRRAGAGQISRVAGRDNFDGIKRQIEAFDLGALLYA